MPVVVIVEGSSRQDYEDVARRVTDGKECRMESPSDWPAEGRLSHVAGHVTGGLQDLGMDVSMEVYPAHAFLSA